MTDGRRRPKANALDLRHPVLRPFWRRVTFVGVLAGWTVIEVLYGNPFWGLLVGGIGVYAAFVLFFDFDPPDDPPPDQAL